MINRNSEVMQLSDHGFSINFHIDPLSLIVLRKILNFKEVDGYAI
jgi:hypothetical protein